jgi:2-polyprenyl-3-methyl-5-hydroxy-6-metoxy-1,4-benzoquinol methylase
MSQNSLKSPAASAFTDGLKRLNDHILFLIQNNELDLASANTIMDVCNNDLLIKELRHNQEFLDIISNFSQVDKKTIEKLRLICMDSWLESTSTLAINADGTLNISVVDGKLWYRKNKLDFSNTLWQQAVLRQIERWAVLNENGLYKQIDHGEPKILDIGSGTLITSVMLKLQHKNAHITAIEPGFISEKTKQIAEKHNITLYNNDIDAIPANTKYDCILLHFVLEHSVKEAKRILKKALAHLAPSGFISIAVPNYHSFHREIETAIDLNQRIKKNRLSYHDRLSGHQVIFTEKELRDLINEVLSTEKRQPAVWSHSILSRPFAFNVLCQLNECTILLDIAKSESNTVLNNEGSVICAVIGNTKYRENKIIYPQKKTTEQLFKYLIKKFIDSNHPEISEKNKTDLITALKKNYAFLVD